MEHMLKGIGFVQFVGGIADGSLGRCVSNSVGIIPNMDCLGGWEGGWDMVNNLSARVERRLLQIESGFYGLHDKQERARAGNRARHEFVRKETSYVDEKIARYKDALETAMRNAPCSGCRRLVLGALVGLAIFQKMEDQGKNRVDFSEDEIEKIKKEIELKYSSY